MSEPEHGLIAIGSGGPFAQSAARALIENTDLDAKTIVEKAWPSLPIFVSTPTTTKRSKSSNRLLNTHYRSALNHTATTFICNRELSALCQI